MITLLERLHPLQQPSADALGGMFETSDPVVVDDDVAECRRIGVRSLGVHGPGPDNDIGWVGQLADQLVDLGFGLNASGHESWPVFPKLKRLSADAWSGEIQFGLFPALVDLSLHEPKKHFNVFPSEARSLRHVSLSEYKGTDLSWLEPLSLKSLVITNSRRLESLAGIETQTDLEHLKVALCPKLTDISSLDGLENLVSLDIESCNRVSDVSVLSTLSRMRYLGLMESKSITSIEALRSLQTLRVLFLTAMRNLDLEPLTDLPQLRYVNFPYFRSYEQWRDVFPTDEDAWNEAIEFRRSVESVDPAELREGA